MTHRHTSGAEDKRLWSNLPFPFGYPEALERVGATAAPLLAGFAFALIGLNVGKRDRLGAPDLALLLLVMAGILLIAAVQLFFTAQQYYVTPAAYRSFRDLGAEDSIDEAVVRDMHREYLQSYAKWAAHTRRAYNWGIALLLAGVATMLIPEPGLSHMAPLRAIAVSLLCLGAVLEGTLVATEWPRRLVGRHFLNPRSQPPERPGANGA